MNCQEVYTTFTIPHRVKRCIQPATHMVPQNSPRHRGMKLCKLHASHFDKVAALHSEPLTIPLALRTSIQPIVDK